MRKLARNNFHYKQLLELNRLNRLRRELTFQLDETRRKKNIVNHLRQVVSNNDVLRRDLLIKFFDRLGLNFKSFLFILQEAKKKIGAKIIKLKGVTPNLVKEDTREEDIEVNNWGTYRKVSPDHFFILKKLKLVDVKAAQNTSGAKFICYSGLGAVLVRSLYSLMLSLHEANGYEEFISPLLVKRESLFGTGHLPKFAAEIFSSDRELFLIPTSEVNLVSQFKNRIFSFEELPKKLVSFSPCFRKEAGAAGKLSHGLLRMHQFLKVELVKLVSEESEEEEFRELLSSATEVLKKLKLPHRVIRLGKKELSFSAAEGFDIEVWLPSQKQFIEVGSCSNCTDFQTKRLQIRLKVNKKIRTVYSMNSSGLAIDRLVATLAENNYCSLHDIIHLPKILEPYFALFVGGKYKKWFSSCS